MTKRSPTPEPASQMWISWVAVIALGVLTTVYVWRQFPPLPQDLPTADQHPSVGKALPSLHLASLSEPGRQLPVAEMEPDVLLINFWGTWCPPCRQELPELAELAAEYKNDPRFGLVAISTGMEMPEDVMAVRDETQAYLADNNLDIPVYLDPNFGRLVVFQAVQSSGYPTTVLVDKSRTIRGVWTGFPMNEPDKQAEIIGEMRSSINELLGNGGAAQK